MTIRNLLRLARRGAATLTVPGGEAAVSSSEIIRPVMRYDLIADSVNARLKRLEHSDPRFLRYASPIPSLVDHSSILAAPETRVTTLSNGLRVATESTLASQTATVGVWIDAGSRFEAEGTNGTAHFLEHMIFKGTASRSVRQLEEEIENMGGHLNAYTSREQTTYYAKVLDKDVSNVLEILADILQNSTFDAGRIERERDVILREMEELSIYKEGKTLTDPTKPLKIWSDDAQQRERKWKDTRNKVEGQTEEVIFDHLHATAFQYTPLGRTILGSAENVKSITQENLKNYIATHYTAPRVVISAAGAVKHEEVVELVKKLFPKLSSDPTTASQLVAKSPASFTGSEVRMYDDDIKLAQFAVAFEGAAVNDPDSIALMVMQAMLGSWSKSAGGGKHAGSELVQRVAINDIAESVMAFNTNYKDTGLFGVYAVAKPDCLDDLSFAIMHAISKLSYRVTDDDVTRARNQLKSSLQLHLDGTTPAAEDIGRQILNYGRRIPTAELFARIDAVDASAVKRVANRFIFDQDVAIAALGPIQNLPDYNWFRRRTYMLRY